MPKAPAIGGRVQSRKIVVSASGMLAVLVPRIVEPSAPVEIESTRRSSPLGVAALGPALITAFRRTGGPRCHPRAEMITLAPRVVIHPSLAGGWTLELPSIVRSPTRETTRL